MADTNVVPLPTPAQRVETTSDGSKYLPLTSSEKVVLHHLRGWPHFGPGCALCMAGAK